MKLYEKLHSLSIPLRNQEYAVMYLYKESRCMKKSIILASAFIAALFVSGCASAHGYRQPNKNVGGYHQYHQYNQYQQRPNGHYRSGYNHNYRPNNQYKSNNHYKSNSHYQTRHGYRAPSNGRFNPNVRNSPHNYPRR